VDYSGSTTARWRLVAAGGALLAVLGLVGFDRLVLGASISLEAMFVVYFVRHLAFAISAMDSAGGDLVRGDDDVVADSALPRVNVLVACRNEESVIGSLVERLVSLDYPSDRLKIVVTDDGSTDGTGEKLDAFAAKYAALTCVHRPHGMGGGKSGALNTALTEVDGDVIVVFDADHEPQPDVIRKLVRHFRDPRVGAVQGRCVIRNLDDSLLSRLVWLDYLGGYLVNEYGRQSLFQLPAYGGANCAVRTSSLTAVGGWNERSVTEDTDLTLRLVLRGDRVRYDVQAVDSEEGVVSLDRFWRQRYRWARGHQQVCRDYRRAVWSSPRLSGVTKLELMLFLYVFHLPIASGAGLLIFGLWVTGLAHPWNDVHTFVFWTLLFLCPLLELGGALMIAGAPRRTAKMLVFFLPVFFVSIALCTKAWLDTARDRPYRWMKTERRVGPIAVPQP